MVHLVQQHIDLAQKIQKFLGGRIPVTAVQETVLIVLTNKPISRLDREIIFLQIPLKNQFNMRGIQFKKRPRALGPFIELARPIEPTFEVLQAKTIDGLYKKVYIERLYDIFIKRPFKSHSFLSLSIGLPILSIPLNHGVILGSQRAQQEVDIQLFELKPHQVIVIIGFNHRIQ